MSVGVLDRPPARPRPPGHPPAAPTPDAVGADPTRGLALAAEAALAAVTVAAALGLGRLFTDAGFLGPVIVAGVGAHALAAATRRRGFGPLVATAISLIGLAVAAAWLVELHTTSWGVPGPATWHAFTGDLAEAWRRFGEVKPPTPTTRGFVLSAVVGTWLVGTVADGFAFRLRARFEAIAPSFTVLIFALILGPAGDGSWGSRALAGGYLAAVLLFVLTTEVIRRAAATPWVGRRTAEGTRYLERQGAALATVAVAVGVVVGPLLPGARAPGIFGWNDDGGGGSRSRTTVSPLVDIRGRLVDQSELELFTVASTMPNYWRLTSLDTFDGTIWSSLGTYQAARGTLAQGTRTTGPEESVVQDFAIGPLSSIWLPAAFRPTRIDGATAVRYDAQSASLLTTEDTSDGLSYRVESALPRFQAERLAGAGTGVPGAIADSYLDLPDDFPAQAAALAATVVRDAGPGASRYEQALALQNWFRSEFVYDLDVPPGHSLDAISQFLAVRRGYCEQFAGTYAALARSLGWPARVAVGFTPGALQPDGRYHVAGKDAHAWPEVYLAGYGWVAFEPTPGRSIPGGDSYTGLAPQSVAGAADPSPPTTSPGGGDTGGAAPEPEAEPAPNDQIAPPGRDRRPGAVGSALILVVVANGAYLAVVAGGRRWLRARRRAAATTASDRVLVSWTEATEALALAGVSRIGSETHGELTARAAIAGIDPGVVAAMGRLAAEATVAGFAPAGADDEASGRAATAAAAVESGLKESAGWRERARWALDPRPLTRSVAEWWRDRADRAGRRGRAARSTAATSPT